MDIRATGISTDQIYSRQPAKEQAQVQQQPAVQDEVSVGKNDGVDKGEHKKWTFLHYGAADNNLSDLIKKDVIEMQTVGSDANTHIISQLDQERGDCQRYYIVKDENGRKLTSPVLENMGSKVDMSSPETLTDFLVWGMKNFPSDHVAVVIGSHGGGTMGAAADDRDGDIMAPADMRKAFEEAEKITGKKVDVLGFDCCLMANTEVAYELKDVADYMVASQESEGGYGWEYSFVMNDKVMRSLQEALTKRINVSPEAFAKKIVDNATKVQDDLPTLSAVDMKKMEQVGKSFDGLANAILATDTPNDTLKSIVRKAEHFDFGSHGFRDSYHFCELIVNSKEITDEKLKAEAQKTMDSLKSAIIANQNAEFQYPNANGLQMEVAPPTKGYEKLQFAKDTMWDEAMVAMYKRDGSTPA